MYSAVAARRGSSTALTAAAAASPADLAGHVFRLVEHSRHLCCVWGGKAVKVVGIGCLKFDFSLQVC